VWGFYEDDDCLAMPSRPSLGRDLALHSSGPVSFPPGRGTETETMILPLTPDEALVVDVARGLGSGSMIEQAHRILMQVPCCVGYHREEGNVEGFAWVCVLAILSVGSRVRCPAPGRCAGLGVRVRPRDIEDELAEADDAGEVAVVWELEVDVALFPFVARMPGADRRVRGDKRTRLGKPGAYFLPYCVEVVKVVKTSKPCNYRSAPATPDGVCSCLFRSFL
jgi:hypothetical protein